MNRLAYDESVHQKCGMKTLILIFLSCIPAFAAMQQWPQYRGPQASGVSSNKPAPIEWSVEEAKNIGWKTPIPGLSHSCPIIWNDRVYVITAVGRETADLKIGLYGNIESANDAGPQQWRLLALDRATGKVIWNVLGHEGVPRVKRHTKATHANSTPATDGKRIVAIFGSEGLFCFDIQGKLIWKKDLGPMDSGYFRSPTAQWGFASSPVIHEGKVVVQCDVQTNSFLAVFNLEDGKEIWRAPRMDVPTWSTPTVVTFRGKTQILVNGWHHTGGYDFATGKPLWNLKEGGDIPVPTPIIGNGVAYFTSAHGRFRPMRAIKLDASGDITPPDPGATNSAIVWAHARQGNYMQTPILVGKNVYAANDNGVVTCFDAATGKIHYSERLGKGREGFTASPVSDGRHLYFPSETGTVFVLPATTEFKIAATNTLGEICMATPALLDGALFFRTQNNLISIAQAK